MSTSIRERPWLAFSHLASDEAEEASIKASTSKLSRKRRRDMLFAAMQPLKRCMHKCLLAVPCAWLALEELDWNTAYMKLAEVQEEEHRQTFSRMSLDSHRRDSGARTTLVKRNEDGQAEAVNGYVMEKTLGRGAFGAVYLARDGWDTYAVKVMRKEKMRKIVGKRERCDPMRMPTASPRLAPSLVTAHSAATLSGASLAVALTEDVAIMKEIATMKKISHPNCGARGHLHISTPFLRMHRQA